MKRHLPILAALLLAIPASAQSGLTVLDFHLDPTEDIIPEESPLPKPGEPWHFSDELPVFIGDLNAYLAVNVRYPDSSRAHEEQGRQVVQFVVDTTGLICDLRIVRSSGFPLLDAAALRALYPMETTAYWKSGAQLKKKVPVLFTLPIQFYLD